MAKFHNVTSNCCTNSSVSMDVVLDDLKEEDHEEEHERPEDGAPEEKEGIFQTAVLQLTPFIYSFFQNFCDKAPSE